MTSVIIRPMVRIVPQGIEVSSHLGRIICRHQPLAFSAPKFSSDLVVNRSKAHRPIRAAAVKFTSTGNA